MNKEGSEKAETYIEAWIAYSPADGMAFQTIAKSKSYCTEKMYDMYGMSWAVVKADKWEIKKCRISLID